jgi:fumarylacetoacetase
MTPATSWVEVPEGSDFPIQNLPYGVVRSERGTRCAIRIGDAVLDLAGAERAGLFTGTDLESDSFGTDSLNPFIAQGRQVWDQVRTTVTDFLDVANAQAPDFAARHELIVREAVTAILPIQIGDYVDFYSSEQHATNLGRMFRPDDQPLLENRKHLPV